MYAPTLFLPYAKRMPPTSEHDHDCFEVGIVTDGSAVHECSHERRTLVPGDVVIIPPQVSHSYPESSGLNMYNIVFDIRKLNIPQQDLIKFPLFQDKFTEGRGERPPEYCFFHLNDKEFRHIRKILPLMREELRDLGRSGYRSAMLGLFMNLMCHLMRSFCPENPPARKSGSEEKVGLALEYLKRHCLEPFSLRQLLKISSMSRSNFMKQFHAIVGMAPRQFVIRRRIAHAVKLIATTNFSLSRIALECGFCDSSHFYKIFAKITNESPRDYRRRIAKQSDREREVSESYIENPFITEFPESEKKRDLGGKPPKS